MYGWFGHLAVVAHVLPQDRQHGKRRMIHYRIISVHNMLDLRVVQPCTCADAAVGTALSRRFTFLLLLQQLSELAFLIMYISRRTWLLR